MLVGDERQLWEQLRPHSAAHGGARMEAGAQPRPCSATHCQGPSGPHASLRASATALPGDLAKVPSLPPQPGREQLLSVHHNKQPVTLSLVGPQAGTQPPPWRVACVAKVPGMLRSQLRMHPRQRQEGCSRVTTPLASRSCGPSRPFRHVSAEGSAVVALKVSSHGTLGTRASSRGHGTGTHTSHPGCLLQRQALEPRPEPAEQRGRRACASKGFVRGWDQ